MNEGKTEKRQKREKNIDRKETEKRRKKKTEIDRGRAADLKGLQGLLDVLLGFPRPSGPIIDFLKPVMLHEVP